MRVAVVTRSGSSEEDGERELVVRAQVRELELLGHAIERVEADGPDAALPAIAGCDVAHLHCGSALSPTPRSTGWVRDLALRAPVVVTVHRLPEAAARADLAAATALVTASRHHARALERTLGLAPGRVHVIPHGLCRPLPRPRSPTPVPRAGGPLVVAHFGTPAAEQGTLDLMRSLSLLPREAVELRLAGPVTDPEVEASWLAARRAGARVRRVESRDVEALAEIADGAHLFAHPSRSGEGYGLVVDEALALGLPAWVSAGGGPAERLVAWGRPGRVLPPRRPLAWAEALGSVLIAPHLLAEQRARVPENLPDAGDAVRMLEQVIVSAAGRSAA